MVDLTLSPLGEFGVETLPPDIVWETGRGDFALAAGPEDGGVGGLKAANPIATAVLMLLFSDVRYDPAAGALDQDRLADDPRGWVGDGFDVQSSRGEAPLGSRLWLCRRATIGEQASRDAQVAAEAALRPLIAQGLADRVTVTVEIKPETESLRLSVEVVSRERTVFAQSYDPLWGRSDGGL
ncbi:phage GP46 family protein [Hansschlegelia zhihuaiae]|uniref:Mu-like prophage protein gp46 n=1 Tax=Hansschlegelia zhihuaiae TaxID=405005 RepID=A0A4Q0M422_9HYPH|nr:phage GP46 family protein [Hansschlegelia zhihuaiae]RXF67680.1 hypothetical protein EK403_20980 [Hansschlegelia zhihuaiae]